MLTFDDGRGRTFARLERGTLVLTERAPAYFARNHWLDLSGITTLVELPANLRVRILNLRGCTGLASLPDGLQVRHLILDGCTGLTELPAGLSCEVLNARGTRINSLPCDLRVSHRIELADCRALTSLPAGLRVCLPSLRRAKPADGSLVLRNCTGLGELPQGLDVGHLDVRGCSLLTALPPRLSLSHLNVSDCPQLTTIPETTRLRGTIELANSGLRRLPDSLGGVRIRWRGVEVPARVAFEPDTLTSSEILGEPNSELRRVMLERVGLDRFLREAAAEELDMDTDPGGERRLIRVPMTDDEDLVCVLVHCPSTHHKYILRVPPTMQTCRAAVAWIAGFDNPDDYRPSVET